MADDNKIQFDVELNEGSVESSFKKVDERAVKSAKESAAVFGEAFQRQEQELRDSIDKIVGDTSKVARKSAKESADVFAEMFRKQDEIYKASVKNSIDNAIAKITGSDAIKKSAKESAAVFEAAFEQGILKTGDEGLWDNILPRGGVQIKSVADLAGGFFLLQQAASAAGAAINGAINFIISGEREMKLDKRFAVLAEQAGLAADVIKGQLKTATAGLIDETKLLEIGSQAFIQLGANAKALPQILELARKTYSAFGGDVVENTEKITQAIFTGQTRQLRSLGILVDTEKVYKDYARSIGTVVPLLSEQQKQTALLNAVLEKGNQTFKNVSAEAGGTESAFKKLSVATTELFDALSVKTAQQSSGIFASLANGATSLINKFTEFVNRDPVQKMNDRLGELRTRLADAQKVLDNVQGSYAAAGRGGEAFVQARVREVERLKEEIAKYEKQIESTAKKQQELARSPATPASAPGVGSSGPSDEEIRRRQELANKVLELNNQLRASEVQLAQEEFNRKQTAANLDALYYQQKLQAVDQYNQQRQQLELFYEQNGINNEAMRQQGRELQEQAHLNRMLQLQIQYNEQKKQVFYDGETAALSTAESFNAVMEGMDQQAKELSVSASKNFKNLGKQMLTSIGQASANAFAAFGQAIAEGDNALEAFGKSLLNSLGNMAIQMGAQFILQGIAYTYAGLANGPPLIAAGAALAAFGGILAASGGAGPRDVSGGGGTAGGGVGNFSEDNNPINDVVGPEDTQPQTPQTAVNLTINGNVLDRRETGLEIAKILEEQFAEQGLVIRGV